MYDEVMDFLNVYYLTSNNIKENDYWNVELFNQKVYTIWAIEELRKEVEKNKNESPIFTIENFISKMDEYSCKNIKTSTIFSVARDVGMYVLDEIIFRRENHLL